MRITKSLSFTLLALLTKVLAGGKIYLALGPGVAEVSVELDAKSTGSTGPIVLDQTQHFTSGQSRTFVLRVIDGLRTGGTKILQVVSSSQTI
jgi:hypothetical protein